MNHRERVMTTLRHQEPDRVPLDFGGTVDSTISAISYQALRQELGLGPSTTRVLDAYQQTAVIEEDVRAAVDVDTAPVFYECDEWRQGVLGNGAAAELPAKFHAQMASDGAQVVVNEAGMATARMPAGGYFFDPIHAPLAEATCVSDIEKCRKDIENFDKPDFLDKSYVDTASKARDLRADTDYALVGFFGAHILQACQILRGWDTFLVDLLDNRVFAETLMDRLHEANMKRFADYVDTVAEHVDIILVEEDLGMQDRPLMRPEVYRELLKPRQMEFIQLVKAQSNAVVLLHTDGAVASMIPDFIEMGVDVLNPIQVSATGMDPKELKREFGDDIAFWGAGCDSQSVLSFGTVQEVEDEVKRRIDELAPGGGYVFSSIHNVQAEVPPENTVAMFRTALEYGVY